MKALVFEKQGLENLKLKEVERPRVGPLDVLVKVERAGVNPIDHRAVTAMNVTPMPHIPGAEFGGVVEEIGERVGGLKVNDRVVIYNRVFDGTCDFCVSGREMICRTGGIIGVVTNGGFAEYAVVPSKNVFKIPEEISWEAAASIPVAALTAYHAMKEADPRPDECVVVFGASGNTGMFAVQFAKETGAKVVAVSRKEWVKDFGADYVVNVNEVTEKVKTLTDGKMADVVLNSLGSELWEKSLALLGAGGRYVTFGALTGGDVKLSIYWLYGQQIRLQGTTGGSRKELSEVIGASKNLKPRIWKIFNLDEGRNALESLSSSNRDGRILIKAS